MPWPLIIAAATGGALLYDTVSDSVASYFGYASQPITGPAVQPSTSTAGVNTLVLGAAVLAVGWFILKKVK